jgi:hypothetical protein
MTKVDMSAEAVTARLRRIAELRRLCLSLQKAKLMTSEENRAQSSSPQQPSPKQDERPGK